MVGFPSLEAIPYDFFTEYNNQVFRVQVKTSTFTPDGGKTYCFMTKKNSKKTIYTPEDCDFLVLYAIPIDAWYIIPITHAGVLRMNVYPKTNGGQYDAYREAWGLLKGEKLPFDYKPDKAC